MRLRCRTDRISGLPESTLLSIVSRLTYKEAARTTVLSKTWRPFFVTLTEFVFDDAFPEFDVHTDERRIVDIIRDSIRPREPPFEPRCEIDTACFGGLDTLLFSDIMHDICSHEGGLKELFLYSTASPQDYGTVPESVFMCRSLVRLELHGRYVDVPSSRSFIDLVNLKHLMLSDAIVNQYDLQHLVSNCGALEELVLESVTPTDMFIVSSKTLLSLKIDKESPMIISLKDAPVLKRLEFCLVQFDQLLNYDSDEGSGDVADPERRMNISHFRNKDAVQFFAELHTLDFLKLQFGDQFARQGSQIIPQRLPEGVLLPNMKKLHVVMVLSNEVIRSSLRCLINSCPNLKELVIEVVDPATISINVESEGDSNTRPSDHEGFDNHDAALDLIANYYSDDDRDDLDDDLDEEEWSYWERECDSADCVKHCLEKVYLYQVNVDLRETLGLLKFLVLQGEVLESITIGYDYDEGRSINELAWQERLLLFQPWASQNLIIQYLHIK